MNAGGSPQRQRADPSALEFKRLTGCCGRGAFRCGEPDIDEWFRDRALSDHEAMRLRVVTAHLSGDDALVGFYALTDHLEREAKLQEPRFILFRQGGYFPTVRLAWLAVHGDMQRRGFGTIIMGAVVQDFYEILIRTGIAALTLTAINERVAIFYEGLGFIRYGRGHQPPTRYAVALANGDRFGRAKRAC